MSEASFTPPTSDAVAGHYARDAHEHLIAQITEGVRRLGKTPGDVGVDDLAPVDEFHIGGRGATERLLQPLGFASGHRILDVGCGLGGAARFVADRWGCNVVGIDLTPDFVSVGNVLSTWVGLSERVTLTTGSGLAMPFGDGHCDGGYMLHVGMNIADKAALFREVRRVLKPRSAFGVYDVMRTASGPLQFPVPWASDASQNALATAGEYRDSLESAGFEVVSVEDRREEASAFFEAARARAKAVADGAEAPPLGLHVLMGASTPVKFGNMIENVQAGLIAPIEIIARAQ